MAIEYISRQAVLAKQRRIELVHHTADNHERIGMDVVQVCDIEEIPAADVRPVTPGKWTGERLVAECSGCGHVFPAFLRLCDYCPGCGAHMTLEAPDGPA